MIHPRRVALIAGSLYLVTVVTSIPALALKAPALAEPASLVGAGPAAALQWASLLEIILAAACVGTAVVLLPVLRRQSESAAFGFLAARVIEAAVIAVGVIAMLALTTLPRGAPGAGPAVDAALVAIHEWAFLIGPGLLPAANALLLGSVLYRSRLVPRVFPILGFIGAPLLLASTVATVFGALDQVSALAGLVALPIALWEIGLGLWLVIRGFNPAALDGLGIGTGLVGTGLAAAR